MRKFTLLGRSSGGIGKGVGQMLGGGVKIATRLAALTALAGAAATAVAISWEDAFAGVKKTVEGTPEQLDAVNASLKALSTRIPVKYTDLTAMAAEAGALGVASSDIGKFTEAVARVTAATVGLDTQEASEAFGKLGTIFKLHDTDYERLGSSLIELGRNFASSEADIVDVTKRFSAAGAAAGLSTADVLGWASAIASLGPESEAAGSSLSRVFNRLTQNIALAGTGGAIGKNATVRLQTWAKVAGVSVKEFTKLYSKDASGAVTLFLEKLGKMDKFAAAAALRKAGIVNVRDIQSILLLAKRTDLLKESVAGSNKAWKENTALVSVSNTRFDTLKSKLIELKNAVLIGADAFGEGLLPALGRVALKGKSLVLDHVADFRRWGVEVGKAIDGIDWSRVERAFITVGEIAKSVLDVVRSLAGLVPEATIGFAGLVGIDKLSGGLLGKGAGNIAGGLFNQFLARGSPANPMWVTSAGGLGGGVGGAGGGGLWGSVKVLGAVTIAGASIVALAQQFQTFLGQRDVAQGDLQGNVNATTGQDFAQSVANIKAVTTKVANMPIWDQTIAVTFGGGQISQDLIGAADRAAKSARGQSREDQQAAISAIEEALKWYGGVLGDIKEPLQRSIDEIKARLNDGGPEARRTTRGGSMEHYPGKQRVWTKEQIRAVQQADRDSRGVKVWSGPSTTIAPRLRFLAGGASGKKDVAVAEALALGFERGKSPAFQSTKALREAILGVSRDIKTLPPKYGVPLGHALDRLKAELGRRTKAASDKAAAAAAKAKETAERTRSATEAVSAEQREGNRISRIIANAAPVCITPTPVSIFLDSAKIGAALLNFPVGTGVRVP